VTLNRANLIVRILATAVGLFAFYLSLEGITGIYESIRESFTDLVGSLFSVVFNLLILAFCAYCVSIAVRVWRPMRASIIRETSAVTCLLLFPYLLMAGDRLTAGRPSLSDHAWSALTSLLAIILLVLFYVKLSRTLIARSTVEPKPTDPISKNLLGLLCFFVWLDLSTLASELWAGPTKDPSRPEALAIFGPGIFAILLYQVLIHYTRRLPGLPILGPWRAARRQRRDQQRHLARARSFQCPGCAYDIRQTLRDHRAICPECGFDLTSVAFPSAWILDTK
jgi:hypothetical protein